MKILYSIILSAPILLSGCGGSSGSSSDADAFSESGSVLAASYSYDGESILAAQEIITVTFTESIDISSISLESEELDIDSIVIGWNADNTIMTMTPATNWPGGSSELSLSFSDTAGNNADFLLELNAALTFSLMQSADVIISDFSVDDVATSIEYPYGNQNITDNIFWIADYDASAIYKFNGIPVTSADNAAEIITSIKYTNSDDEIVNLDLDGPQTPFVYNDQLMFVDYNKGIIGIYNNLPESGQDNLGIVLGLDAEDSCSSNGLSSPEAVIAADNKLLVVDADNSRILIWNEIPDSNSDTPDLVLGQNSFDSCSQNDDNQDGTADDQPSARTLSYPSGVWTDGEKLIVVDGNSRVLIWNNFPTENFMEADLVLGQPDFISNIENNDVDDETNQVASARTLNYAYEGIYSNGAQIFVTDSGNNRVLIWNTWPTENFTAADALLGQSTFLETEANNDQESAIDAAFSNPAGISISDDQIIVSDVNNGRVMLFKSL